MKNKGKDNSPPELSNGMEKIVGLAKRRGFVFPSSEIYGGFANAWDYGPLGAELKKNIKDLWWQRFVRQRDDMVGIDAALIMNPKVWEASGHVATFSDPLMECKKCNSRFRPDQVDGILEDVTVKKVMNDLPGGVSVGGFKLFITEKAQCPECGAKLMDNFAQPRQFNLMLKTFIGPSEEQANIAYLRPETAQAMFVDFKNVLQTSRKKLPFGIAQIGKAFRNEITPGNFIFRTREFEQMEIEYFIPQPKKDKEWEECFELWRKEMMDWMTEIGLDMDKVHELEVPKEELAHYSKRTIDFEYDFPFGKKELYGLAYRTDFDLANHMKNSGEDLKYTEEGKEPFIPHVIEPTWGVDRTLLAVLCNSFDDSDPERTVLKLPYKLAPYKAAVFPLLKNKPELVEKAKGIFDELKRDFMVAWDDRGNVGKRYYSQDEIGTPFCITVDFQTLEDGTVTIRHRDSAKQERIDAGKLAEFLFSKMRP